MQRVHIKLRFSQTCASLLVGLVLIQPFFVANASGAPVIDAAHISVSSVTAANTGLVAGNSTAANSKEFTLDQIPLMIAKAAATALTQSIVNWINSGFEGNPSFITDLEGFMLDVADESAAEFISQLDSETQAIVCTPFAPDIKFALTVDYLKSSSKNNRAPRCSLDDVFANAKQLEKFIDGDFAEGGLDGFFNVAVNQQNNPYGSYLHAKGQMTIQLSEKLKLEANVLDWGGGFMSKKNCTPKYIADEDAMRERYPGRKIQEEGNQLCAIVTPGITIENQLASVLGSGIRQLELADELGEIVSALMAQLTKEVIVGAKGLLGTSQVSVNSGSTYLEQVVAEQAGLTGDALMEGITTTINLSRELETKYKSVHELTLTKTQTANTALMILETCLAGHSKSNPLLANAFTFAQSSRSTIDTTIAQSTQEVTKTNDTLLQLIGYEGDVAVAKNFDQLNEIYTSLQSFVNGGGVHSNVDLSEAQTEAETTSETMATILNTAPTHLAVCGI